jgi:hypothetical protein
LAWWTRGTGPVAAAAIGNRGATEPGAGLVDRCWLSGAAPHATRNLGAALVRQRTAGTGSTRDRSIDAEPDLAATGVVERAALARFAFRYGAAVAGLHGARRLLLQRGIVTSDTATGTLHEHHAGSGDGAGATLDRAVAPFAPGTIQAMYGILGSMNTLSPLAKMRNACGIDSTVCMGAASAVDGGSAAVRLLPAAKLGAGERDAGARPFGVLGVLLQVRGQRLLRDQNLNVLADIGIVVADSDFFSEFGFARAEPAPVVRRVAPPPTRPRSTERRVYPLPRRLARSSNRRSSMVVPDRTGVRLHHVSSHSGRHYISRPAHSCS